MKCEHGDFKKEGDKCEICPEDTAVSESPSVTGSTTRLLIEKKIASLTERYSKACDGNDHMEGIKLYAQISLLDNMWLDIVRIEGE